MKSIFRIVVGTVLILWIILGLILHGLVLSFFYDNEIALTIFCIVLTLAWWGISVLVIRVLIEWKKESIQERKAEEYKKKYLSDVEIENVYFGNGILVKDSSAENIYYKDIKSGFDRLFDQEPCRPAYTALAVSAIEVFAVEAINKKCCQEKSRQH